ncbi:MAG TPA: tetratricopeptide repeat protein, partial [Tepidisphaeraceae bacterium]
APAVPTTQASANAPLEAIEIFAKARDMQLQHQPYNAINLYEKALTIDPDSFELNYALGRVCLGVRGMGDRAIAALERAARIQPNDLECQVELGRAYQARSDAGKSIEHFRLAMQTDDYRTDDALAAVVDYRLGVALEQQGYYRASLQCYESLVRRLQHPGTYTRTTPEIGLLLARPESLFDEMGKLYEKLGNWAMALDSYRVVAEHAPNDFDLQARVVNTLVKVGDEKDATAEAADLVRRFHASPDSMGLLRSVYSKSRGEAAFVDELRRLHEERPGDRAILFALADTLASSGRVEEARSLLSRAVEDHDGDIEIAERLWHLYSDRDDVNQAARLIIHLSAEFPDTTSELEPLFLDLLRLSRKNALRVTTVQALDVPSDEQAAKRYWVWRVASLWTRPQAARTALDQAAHSPKPFDPACRAQLESYLARSDWPDAARDKAIDALIESVRTRGRPDLAAELRGLVELQRDRLDQAVSAFGEAVRLSGDKAPPDLQLEYAIALQRQGNGPRFEQLMWKLLSDRPRFGAGYLTLLAYFGQNHDDQRAWDLTNRWLTADPNSIAARLQQCAALIQQRRGDEALLTLRRLFDQYPDDPQVVGNITKVLAAIGQVQQAIDLLEGERAAHPGNRVVVENLIDIYASQKRFDDATRVLDATRAAVSNDADLLYYVAHLYEQVDRKDVTEQVLQDVLKLDPRHSPAANDLGYTWADEGKNLERAESLIRGAVDAEPDNPSYLDSLAWVLYKRGRFDEARKLLEQACEPMESADPVVLDHLGDTLYRLNRGDDARQAWQHSMDRMQFVGERDELKELKVQLQAKLSQAQAGQPVNVAPVVESPGTKTQAKS